MGLTPTTPCHVHKETATAFHHLIDSFTRSMLLALRLIYGREGTKAPNQQHKKNKHYAERREADWPEANAAPYRRSRRVVIAVIIAFIGS